MIDYAPCSVCDAKSGAYTLCKSCLHNRDTISRLDAHRSELRQALADVRQMLKGPQSTNAFSRGAIARAEQALAVIDAAMKLENA